MNRLFSKIHALWDYAVLFLLVVIGFVFGMMGLLFALALMASPFIGMMWITLWVLCFC